MIRVVAPERIATTDSLRPPSALDLLAHAYKDWLHVNVFSPEFDVVVVLNASLHGDPLAASSLGVGTFIVHRANRLVARVDVLPQLDVEVGAAAIGVGTTSRVALGEAGWFLAASGRAGNTVMEVCADAVAAPIDVESPASFGSGWISWRAVPRLRVEGMLRLDGEELRLDGAAGYHDHNWGRWRWGDDIGWRWGTFPVADADATVTVAHRTNRRHRVGFPIARLQAGALVRDYPGRTVSIEYVGRRERPLRRLPGGMAAMRSDRQRPDLPERVVVRLVDGFDEVVVEFAVTEAVQVVTAEPTGAGHTFIHELLGSFELSGRVAGHVLAGRGLGVFEHVD
jgi:hypothetical protein